MGLTLNKGTLVASVLAGSWRQFPSPLEISAAQLEIAAPGMLASGAAALAWKRVSKSKLRTASVAKELEQAYRLHTLQSAIHERAMHNVLALLSLSGIHPGLAKGCAIARIYPESGWPPYVDMGLCGT